MKREILSEAVKLNIDRRRKKRWHKAVSAMAAVVVFVTTYALILPAITMERETICGLPEHSHDQACWFSPTIDLGKTLDCGFANHVHMAECIGTDGDLICGQADYVAHYHDQSCLDADGKLVCTLENRPEHSHSDECYEVHDTYVCGLQEGEGSHAHTSDCYSIGELVCTLEECEGHSHGDGCFDGEELVCKLEETQGHTHGGDCFGTGELVCNMEENPGHEHSELCAGEPERELICTLKETALHTHTQQCFDTEGNLICMILQVLAHQHGEDCFVYHEHGDECYGQSESGDVLICRYHVHDEGCLDDNGDYICSQPELICGMEEHSHTQDCYPLPDDMVEVSYVVPEEYLEFVESETAFPALYQYKEGSSIESNGGAPPIIIMDTDNYLAQYCWVDQYGIIAEESVPVYWNREFTLCLYPADDPEAAQPLDISFGVEDKIVFSGKVNRGAEFAKLLELPVLNTAVKALETRRNVFSAWTLEGQSLYDEFVVEKDSFFCADFEEHLLLRLHDIGPNGTEQGEGAIEVYLPRGQSLAELDAVLFDGTPAAGCLWYDAEGQLIDTAAGFDSDTEIYTYSFALTLNFGTEEAEEHEVEYLEEESVFSEAIIYNSSGEAQTDYDSEDEAPAESEGDRISIVKRESSALEASDFVVDGIDYGSFLWVDEQGMDVDTDDLVGTSLTENYDLIMAAATTYTIKYNINVNSSNVFGSVPTVGGESTLSDTYSSDQGNYTIRIPNPTSYMVTSGNKRLLYQFTGWKISRNSNIIQAGEIVDASWVSSNVNRRTTTVNLTAQWSQVTITETVHFFVNVNCQVTDVDGNTDVPNSGDFTPSVYSTTMSVTGASMRNYWQGAIIGGSQYVLFRADNAHATAEVDSEIRRLINGHDSTNDTYNGKSVWKSGYAGTKIFQVGDFPSDEHVLSVVRTMVRNGTVIRMNGVPISEEQLTTDNFTVRWNVCKWDTGDGWHIDGILVGKQAYISVKKTFLGDEAAIETVKDGGYSITVRNTGNSSASDITLTLNPAAQETTSGCVGYESYNSQTNTYTWTVPLQQDNKYTVIENNYELADGTVQTSAVYTISNSPAAFTGWQSYPDEGIANITAYAYASDLGSHAYQNIELRNSYVKADTLTISKVDMETGNGLAGVSYRLTDESGHPLTLYKKPDASYYSMKQEDMEKGFVLCPDSVITTDGNGAIFLKLESGSFTLEEAFPTGYGGYSKIHVTVGVDSSGNVVFDQIFSSDSTIEVDGVLVDKNTATLTIKNVSIQTSVTAQKVWVGQADADSVTVELLRNGISLGSGYQVVLNAGNNWTYTWDDLPLYADGAAAKYSLREMKIGSTNHDPSADTDGYSGYIVAYDEMIYRKNGQQVSGPVWTDENGVTQYADNAYLVVRNEVYRGQMVFLKVDGEGNPLPGATFRLYKDQAQTQLVAEATSDQYGRVIFENLVPDTYYVMKEFGTPDGYLGADSLYKVRLSSRGSTTLEDNSTGEVLTAIVNYADEVEVNILKQSELGYALEGVQFSLEVQENGVWTKLGDYTSDAQGQIALGELGAGSYKLAETKPPDGFMALRGEIIFEISGGELTLSTHGDWSQTQDAVTDAYLITVINRSGYELPSTGGFGYERFILSGAVLLLLGALGCVLLRRREEDSS